MKTIVGSIPHHRVFLSSKKAISMLENWAHYPDPNEKMIDAEREREGIIIVISAYGRSLCDGRD